MFPLDLATSAPVEVLCLTDEGPLLFEGFAIREADERIVVDLSTPAREDMVGAPAIVTFLDGDSPRITARVLDVSGNRLSLAQPRVRPRDKRLYPRLYGNIPLRYRLFDPHEGELYLRRWLEGQAEGGPDDAWRTPEPFMNFSVTGLCFEDDIEYPEDALLLLDMGVGDEPERYRATGRVVRVKGEAGGQQIALSFEDLSDEAMDALSRFTLSIQEALL